MFIYIDKPPPLYNKTFYYKYSKNQVDFVYMFQVLSNRVFMYAPIKKIII
jgi:hypothetical protein